MKIAIVGAGLIGRSWAVVFARAGFDVALYDPVRGAARRAVKEIGRGLAELAEVGLVADPAAALARVSVAADLAGALKGAALAQESGPEKLDVKQALYAEMDRLAAPTTILASSTSFIVASRFAKGLKGRRRCLVAHPVNPPHLVPIVELCPAPFTDPKVVARARRIYDRAGQVPVLIKKEAFGFVLNRLQAVLMAEAFRLVGAGVVSPQDLDKTMRDGLGLRWSFIGPFEVAELNAPGGIPDYVARYGGSMQTLVGDAIGRAPFAAKNAAAVMREWAGTQTPARVARLTRWRDRRLAALKAHKLAQPRRPA